MVKIGLICWKQGGGANDYIKPTPRRPWLKNLKIVQKGPYKGKIPFEKALQAALEYNYDDVEVMFINSFDESKLTVDPAKSVLILTQIIFIIMNFILLSLTKNQI